MEWAGYEMLIRFAEAAGDAETVAAARLIGSQERTMMERLEHGFDAAEQASHRDTPATDRDKDLSKHLAEAHALEGQAIQLLGKGENIAGDPKLAEVYRQNLQAAKEHAQLVEHRLAGYHTSESTVKDTAMGLFGLNWGFFFQAQSDTPSKLAAFVYAFEHLKIAGYELLLRSARRGGDVETQKLCETVLTNERTMVARLAETFDAAAAATLAVVQGK